MSAAVRCRPPCAVSPATCTSPTISTSADVLQLYRDADLFVLASRVARSGDRDGLPNVLMEAQSQGLACIASNTAAIPELIDDRQTGRLVPPERPQALTDALVELIGDPTPGDRHQPPGKASLLRVE